MKSFRGLKGGFSADFSLAARKVVDKGINGDGLFVYSGIPTGEKERERKERDIGCKRSVWLSFCKRGRDRGFESG